MEISRRAVILCSLCLVLAMNYCCAQEIGASCQLLYTEQPPDFLPCNPYRGRELRLECTVESPLQTSLSVDVAWFHSPKAPGPLQQSLCYANELQELERKISILRQENFFSASRNVRSQLRVFNLTDLDSGTYWCTVRANGLQQLLPSDPVFLERSVVYAELPACSAISAVSKEENKCAILPASVLPQITPSCSSSTTTFLLRPTNGFIMQPMVMVLPTATPLSSEVLPQGSQDMLTSSEFLNVLQSTTSSSAATQPSMSVELEPSAVIPEVTASDANNGPTEFPHTPLPNPPPFLPQLYIGIGVIVLLGVIITVLLSVFICLCLRSHRLKVSKVDRQIESNSFYNSGRSRSCSRTPLRHHMFDSVHSSSIRSTQTTNGSVLLNVHCRPESESSNDINSVIRRIPVCRNFENTNSIDHSYETVLSNEYEDVIEVRENRAYAGSPVHVKRNRAYRAFALEESETIAAGEPQEPVSIQRPQDYILPYPTHLKLDSS